MGLRFSLEFILASAARAASGNGPGNFEASDDKPVSVAATAVLGMLV